jgi:glycogen operon protein
VTAHDGFTLNDLVSYNDKHNEANQENNQDGHPENLSFNFGVEGSTDDPAIVAQRAQQMRNFLATLLLSQGTPMVLAGDEVAHSQGGNNNAYCQDNETTWLDWTLLDTQTSLLSFARKLIALRRAHPVLRGTRFLHGNFSCKRGIKDITWFTPQGTEKAPEQWMDPVARCIGVLLNGQAGPAIGSHGSPIEDDLLLIILNSHHDIVEFTLPQMPIDREWTRLIDTADPDAAPDALAMGAVLPIKGRSLAVLSLPALEPAEP